MGANQSTCKGTSGDPGVYSSTPGASSSCLMEMLKPECLKTEKKNKRKREISPETKKTICNNDYANSKGGGSSCSGTRKTTLEEWLMASPGSGHGNISGGELYVLKQNSRRIHPAATTSSSSSKQPAHRNHETSPLAEKARDSFSSQRLVVQNDGDEAKLGDSFSNRSCWTRSEIHNKVKKKVSFRFPKEADIFLFYPSEEIMTTESGDDVEAEDEVYRDVSSSSQDLESESKTSTLVS